MSSLVIEPGFFNSERDVVKEELRSRVLAAPYGRLFYLYLPQISYDVHPYAPAGHRQHRGSRRGDDRRRARLPRHLLPARQCGAGRRRQFRPGPARPLGRSIFRADRAARDARSRASPRSSRTAHAGAPLHRLRGEHAAAGGADLLSGAAGERPGRGGDGGARRHPLDRRELAAAPEPRLSRPDRRPGQLLRRHQAGAGQSRRLCDPLARARAPRPARPRCAARSPASATTPVTRRRTGRGAERIADRARCASRETVEGQAEALAEAVIVDGDPRAADRAARPRSPRSRPADIQRVARRWLRDEAAPRSAICPRRRRNGAARATRSRTAATVAAAPLVTPRQHRHRPAGARGRAGRAARRRGRRSCPPCPRRTCQRLGQRPDRDHRAEPPAADRHRRPRRRAAASPPIPTGRAGTAALDRGGDDRGHARPAPPAQIDSAVEALGSSLSSSAGWDGSQIGITVRTERGRRRARHHRRRRPQRDPAGRGDRAAADAARSTASPWRCAIPARSPAWPRRARSTARRLTAIPPAAPRPRCAAITRDDVEAAYRAHLAARPRDPDPVRRHRSGAGRAPLARASFRQLARQRRRRRSPASAAAPAARRPGHRHRHARRRPGGGRGRARHARPAAIRAFYRALVANAVLGGGYSARLNQEIRIRRGLSYGAGSSIDARRAPGPFIASHPDPQRRRRRGARPGPRRDAAAGRRADPGRGADRPARLADRRFRARHGDHVGHRRA